MRQIETRKKKLFFDHGGVAGRWIFTNDIGLGLSMLTGDFFFLSLDDDD